MELSRLDQKLIDMALVGNYEGVKEALRQGADIHAEHDSAFCCAARCGNTKVAALLLDSGVDIRVQNDTILREVAVQGYKEMVELLLDRGMDVHAYNETTLRLAARFGHTELVRFLLDKGADIHAQDDEAFREAAAYGHMDTVLLLLDHGANIHANNDDALQRAAFNNQLDTADLLLRLEKDSRVEDDEMLCLSAQNDYGRMTILLLRHGADPKVVQSPYKIAVDELVRQLKQEAKSCFLAGKPERDECFAEDKAGKPKLQDKVLDSCLSDTFTTRIGAPLVASKDKADRQLFQDIWEALPKRWKNQYQPIYVQFAKEGGINPAIGSHTARIDRDAGNIKRAAGR